MLDSKTTVGSGRPASATDAAIRQTTALLDELLVHSIELRNMYKSAYWQVADIQLRGLRILFDGHYKEQLRLVDVLLDRRRMLGGEGRPVAGLLLQRTQHPDALRGRMLPIRLLHALLNAHDTVLCAAESGANSDRCSHTVSSRDFAVGQVVLVNTLQLGLISDQLIARSDKRRVIEARQQPRWLSIGFTS